MPKLLLIGFSSACILLTACGTNAPGNNTGSNNDNGNAANNGQPVETGSANTNYKPAFEGQTRVAAVKTNTAYEGRVISSELENPWGITTLPDGRLLITQKRGTMRIANADGQVSQPITGLPPVNAAGQGGLLGVTTDPDFNNNRMVYWTFSENRPEGTVTSVAKGKLSSDEKKIENAMVIYRATPVYDGDKHYGSRIIFDGSGNLFVSTGERSDRVTRPQAQDLNSGLGKILRITKDGQPVDGNPFIGQAGAKPEVYSYGHRNVQGLAIHPASGALWASEFGPRGGDELNLIQPGKNYGWPVISYGIEYGGSKIGEGITQKEGMEQPVYYWDPVLSPSGMTFYSSNQIPEWQNNLFISGLNSNHIARIVLEDQRVVGEERLLANEGQRFRDVTEGKDGALYAVTDGGRLYRIGKAK